MKLTSAKLFNHQAKVYYLFGEDRDALMEAADKLLQGGLGHTQQLRLDVEELSRFLTTVRSPSLFGPSSCFALLRDAASAKPNHCKALLEAVQSISGDHRLIICACSGDMYKKAWHKKMVAMSQVACCEFSSPTEQGFQQWLLETFEDSELHVVRDDIVLMSAQLNGMRAAARQLIQRLQLYDNGAGKNISLTVMRELCGEQSPEALDDWCHATAMRQPHAVRMAHQLLRQQQVHEVQMIMWLSTRFQQLLMYCWYEASRQPNPIQQAKVFGSARQLVPQEAHCWKGVELINAIERISQAEQQIKGASIESGATIVERLTLELCRGEEIA